jgi:hypothetical protein
MLAVPLLLLCVLVRIAPHPPNMAPVGAAAVLAGRTLPPGVALALTAATMALSDLCLAAIHGWQPFGPISLFIHAGFAAQVLIARALRRVRGGALAAALFGGTAFFVTSNLGVWLLSGMYPRDAAGLVACYVAALPFWAATLVGDAAWTVALTSIHAALSRRPVHA